MTSHKATDGDTGEVVTIGDKEPLPHCFIVRLDDELLSVVLRHQNRLARGLRHSVSRAAAVREVLRRALPKKKPAPQKEQMRLWPDAPPLRRDLLVAVEADRVVKAAEARLRP